MYSYVAALAIAGSASALVVPRQDGCCFELKASGEQSGTIGQLDDGQNRIGGGLSPATYCINDGAITDSNGRGCILTPPTTQFQCDEGATPTEGFSVSGEGEVQYNGSSKFYACGADKDEYNLYTKPVEGQEDCVEVTLSSSEGKCSGNGGGGGEGASSSASRPAESAASSKPAGGQSTAPAESAASKPAESAASSKPANGQSTAPAESSAPKPSNSAPASSPASGSSGKASKPAETPGGYQSQPSAPATSAPASSAPAPAPSAPAETAPAECHPETVTVTVTQPCEASQQTGNTGVPGGGSPPAASTGGGAGPSSYGRPKPSGGAQTSNGAQLSGNVPQPSSNGGAGPSSYGAPNPSNGAQTSKGVQPSDNVPQPSSAGGASSAQASVPATSTVVKSSEKPSQPAVSTAPTTGEASKPAPSVGSGSGSGSSAASSKAPSASAPAPYPTGSSAEASSAPAGTGSASEAASSTKSTGTGTASGSACQTDLSGAYQTPHLIVPVSSDQPDEAFGTNYNGQINETTSTIFNFDIPQDYEGKQCSIIFLFPKKEDLETSDYEFGGSGSLGCSELSSAADEQTSYSNAPSVDSDLGTIDLKTGNSYVVATQDCKAGTTQSIELSSKNGLDLNFFEDWNPSPLGLYITSC